jgi:hypothetical protein
VIYLVICDQSGDLAIYLRIWGSDRALRRATGEWMRPAAAVSRSRPLVRLWEEHPDADDRAGRDVAADGSQGSHVTPPPLVGAVSAAYRAASVHPAEVLRQDS